MGAALKIESNRIDDSFYGVTSNTRNTIKENDIWTYFTDRNGLGDIIQKSMRMKLIFLSTEEIRDFQSTLIFKII
jgi:hypothetical protein